MIEGIVIRECIGSATCIERRVNVNQLHLARVALLEAVQGEQVVALEDQIVVLAKLGHGVFAVGVVAPPAGQHLGGQQAVNLIRGQDLVPEDLIAFLVFLGLAALQHAVLVGPGQHHITAFAQVAPIGGGQANLVLETGVGVGQEGFVVYKADEFLLVKDQHAVHSDEKVFLEAWMGEEQAQQAGVEFERQFGNLVFE